MSDGTVACITAILQSAQDRVNSERKRLFEEIGILVEGLERIAKGKECCKSADQIARETLDEWEEVQK